MNAKIGLGFAQATLSAGLYVFATHAAEAAVIVTEHHVTLLNVVQVVNPGPPQVINDINEAPAGAAAIAPGSVGPGLAPGLIVGVYLAGGSSAHGFTVTNPPRNEADKKFPDKVNADAISTGLSWVQPYDVNYGVVVNEQTGARSAPVFVGRARTSGPLYAAVGTTTGVTPGNNGALSNLNSPSQWAASGATSINNGSKLNGVNVPVVVGWKQPAGSQAEQAFYTYLTNPSAPQNASIVDIKFTLPSGKTPVSSRALSVSTPSLPGDHTLVAGFYRLELDGPPRGFVYDIEDGKLVQDLGRVVIPTLQPIDQAHYVSINAKGWVAATAPVPEDSLTSYQAFVLDGQGNRSMIRPFGRFEDTFAAGISDTGWVVGALFDRDSQGLDRYSGFLWVAGQTFNLSDYLADMPGWTGITWALDVDSFKVLGADGKPTGFEQGTIVGMGKYNGQQRAFAMQMTVQVPEPQTYVMLGLGLLAIATLRMRRFRRS